MHPGSEIGRAAYELTSLIAIPRLTGTAGEKTARERITVFLAGHGLRVDEEWFRASDYMIRVMARFVLIPAAAGFVLSALAVNRGMDLAAMLLAFAGFIASLAWLKSSNGIRERGGNFFCANLIVRPANPDPGALNVILMAHYDSKSQPFSIKFRILLFIASALLMGILLILISSCAAIELLGANCPFKAAILPAALVLGFSSLLMTLNRHGNLSDGALDNATGTGIVAEAAARLATEPAPGVNLIALITAAEEIGLEGAKDFVRAHHNELDPKRTVILNFDGCASRQEITILARGKARQLTETAIKTSRELGFTTKKLVVPVGMATDLNPFLRQGYQGIDFVGEAYLSHTPRDRMNLVDREAMAMHVRLAIELVKKLGAA